MKIVYRSWSLLLSVLLIAIMSGCAEVQSLTAVKMDPSMPVIKDIKTVVTPTSVAFEWKPINDRRVDGIDVYRAIARSGNEQKFVKIATIDNRYSTHYVDTDIEPGRVYIYVFKTFGVLYGSAPGEMVRVETLPPLPPVAFVKAYIVDPGVVKILWKPHPDPHIHDYIIERKLEGREWKYLANVKGRLSPEYIDMSPAKGRKYSYHIIARSADGFRSKASEAATVTIE